MGRACFVGRFFRDSAKITGRTAGRNHFTVEDKEYVNEVVARIVPAAPPRTVKVADLDGLFAKLPKLDPEDAERFEQDLRSIRREATLPESKWG
jgi:hypothetical protein